MKGDFGPAGASRYRSALSRALPLLQASCHASSLITEKHSAGANWIEKPLPSVLRKSFPRLGCCLYRVGQAQVLPGAPECFGHRSCERLRYRARVCLGTARIPLLFTHINYFNLWVIGSISPLPAITPMHSFSFLLHSHTHTHTHTHTPLALLTECVWTQA